MFKNYWTTALRSFRTRLSNTLVLFFGLFTAITAFILIVIFVFHERSFDKFHVNSERIFRLQQNHYSNDVLTNSSAACNFSIGSDMATDFPEIERYTFILKTKSILRKDNEVFKEESAAFVSKDFFKVFSFKLLKGNDSLALSRPYTIVLSETLARKIFKNEDPIGKTVNYKGRYEAEVTGVFQDMPENSHINLHVLLPYETFKKFANPAVLEYPWRWDGLVTYILLNRADQHEIVQQKIPDLIERKNGAWLRESNQQLEINLQALRSIHLTSHFNDELGPNGDQQTVTFLSIIAFAILAIACINYISLATVRSLDRAKEVGVRKVLGSLRSQIVNQFMVEAFILNFTALVVALILAYIAFPDFSALFERNFSAGFLKDPAFWVFAVSLLLICTLLTGIYPAFVLSAVRPAEILKGKFSSDRKGKFLRKITIFIPFTSTVILLICLFAGYIQLEFLKSRELGFDPNEKLVVRDSEIYDSLYAGRVDIFKKEVLRIPGIESLTYVSHLPGEFIDSYNDGLRLGDDKKNMTEYRFLNVDENFTAVLRLTIIFGKSFTSTSQKKKEVMVNETASKLLGFVSPEDALEQRVVFSRDTVTIKAIVKDYHQEAPKAKIPPTYYLYNPNAGFYFVFPISNAHPQVVNSVQKLFKETFPGQPFNYFFLADKYESQYNTDEKFGKIIFLFLMLLLAITCSGLFSLASYTTKFRKMEIGVRKIMGASVKDVVFFMLKDYVMIVLAATIIGCFISFFAIENWLLSFSMKIELHWWIFVIPAIVVMIIALLTVLGQTLRAAYANPAHTLKDE